jgi:UDP-2,3-diacylglucosamine pyrophosphatase LpxH
LHIGGSTALDIFNSQAQLAGFLKSLKDKPQTLIINGDFIDFLAVEPFGSFGREGAEEKIRKIVGVEPNQKIWEAFRAFLRADKRNRIDILLGNHDVEMVFEEVQTALRGVMADSGEGERVRFLFDRLSYPRLVVGGVHVHVEHGFQFDKFNWYDHNALMQATENKQDGAKFELPVGSRLVYSVLNKLTKDHPFIPLLKPQAAVYWMMVALAPKEVLKNAGALGLIGEGNFLVSLRKSLRGVQLGAEDEAEPAGPRPPLAALQSQLTEMLFDEGLNDETVTDAEDFLTNGTGDERPGPGLTFSSNPLLRGKLFFVRRALKALQEKRDNFFDPAQYDEFKRALNELVDRGAKVAIFGHSHARKMHSLFVQEAAPGEDLLHLRRPSLLYVNTGTWANLLDFDPSLLSDDEKTQQWLDELEAGTLRPTLAYTYARLEERQDGRGVRVTLAEWRDGGHHQVVPPQDIFP